MAIRLSALLLFLLSRFVSFAQVPGSPIDVQRYTYFIELNDSTNVITCKAIVTLKFTKNASSFNLDLVKKNAAGKGMLISSIIANEKPVAFTQHPDDVTINYTGTAGNVYICEITYSGIPADGLIISTNKYGKRTFFGDNWPNRGHNWLVCVDDPADKAAVDFIVTAPAHYDVVANGEKMTEIMLSKTKKQTYWRETAQISTKIMVIGVADFAITKLGDVNNIPVYSYVFPQDSLKGVKSYSYAKEVLPFFINKIGPYAYKKLANVQSKTMFGGMENAGAIFYFENSPGDKDVESLVAHEVAHQWFGDAASEKNFYNVWLSEGFATYLTNYYLENKYGADTLKKSLAADRSKVIAFEKQRMTPVVDTSEKKVFLNLLNANSYEKGSWALHMLRRKLGDEVFWKGIRQYFAEYNGSNANTMDFKKVMEKTSGKDLSVFFKQWLYTAGHPDVVIRCQYMSAIHTVKVIVTQQQDKLYNFPLDISIDGKLNQVEVNSREVTSSFSVAKSPGKIIADPNVNLLGSFTVTKE